MIDVHTHHVSREFPDMSALDASPRWPRMEMIDAARGQVMIAGRNFRTVDSRCWDPPTRLRDMDAAGVAVQAVSVMPELLTYWAAGEPAAAFAHHLNQGIAAIVAHAPDRFVGLGMVPLQDPERAARELERCMALDGIVGVEVGSHVGDRPLGDPAHAPFFAAAERLGAAILVHALHPLGDSMLVGPPILNNYVGFPLETGFSVASIITGGILEQFPRLRIGFCHGGGALMAVLPRLSHGWQIDESVRASLPRPPEEYARRLFFDTLVYDERTLRYLHSLVGPDQLMVGSDYPFIVMETPPGALLASSSLPDEDKQRIREVNARRFLYGPEAC
jgi:aminocarboxymuconate-semialdehyde decarboxylase